MGQLEHPQRTGNSGCSDGRDLGTDPGAALWVGGSQGMGAEERTLNRCAMLMMSTSFFFFFFFKSIFTEKNI